MKLNVERHSSLFLFLIVLLGLGLRVYHLGLFPLWIDEGFTRYYSESALSYLWTTGFDSETTPPTYYTLMHFWIPLFGASESALRFPSVVASVLLILLVYALGKELESRTVGLIGALVMALSPSEIWYAQEARSYALLQVAICLALLGLSRYLLAAESRGGLVCYTLGALGAVYCHNTALLFVVACNLAVLGPALFGRSLLTSRGLVWWLTANGVAALAIVPLFVAILGQMKTPSLNWIPPLTVPGLFLTWRDLIGGPAANCEFQHGHVWAYLLPLAIAGLLIHLRKLDFRDVTILVLVPVIFCVLVLLASLHRPILLPRVFLWTWMPLSLLLAHVLVHGAKTRLPLLVVTTLVIVIGLDAQYFPYFPAKENWRDFVRSNREEFAKADVVVLASPASIGCFVYYEPTALSRTVFWPVEKDPRKASVTETFFCQRFQLPLYGIDQIRDEINSGKRVCLLVVDQNLASLDPPLATLPPARRDFEDVYPAYKIHLLSWGPD